MPCIKKRKSRMNIPNRTNEEKVRGCQGLSKSNSDHRPIRVLLISTFPNPSRELHIRNTGLPSYHGDSREISCSRGDHHSRFGIPGLENRLKSLANSSPPL